MGTGRDRHFFFYSSITMTPVAIIIMIINDFYDSKLYTDTD